MNEQIILRDKPSIIPYLIVWPTTGILFACPLITIALTFKITIFTQILITLAILALILATIRLFADIINREFTNIILTETKLIAKQGILDRDGHTIPLKNVQTTHIQHPPAGQILNYGNLIITTAGGTIKVKSLPHPQRWESEILKRI